eukprot:TRINITY_DN63216_c0_g2_i2.p1 TRINITY_DN63216_c0_g2~~TRINITY_DN63216_c0_g2_i2.p1  ORF type:complete len:180 (+),score=16.61 TRINITY_DN63216_c0_g2_i2:49-588(+)
MVSCIHAPKVIRTGAFLGLCGVIATGVLCFMTCELTALQMRILAGYLPFFGVMGIFAELTIFGFLRKFAFLTSWIGKGLFYFFVGTLCVEYGVVGWIVGIFMMVLGVVTIVSRIAKPQLFVDNVDEEADEKAGDVENPPAPKPKPASIAQRVQDKAADAVAEGAAQAVKSSVAQKLGKK